MTIFSQLLIAFSFSFFFMNEREFQIIWEQRGMRPALTLTRGTWAMTRTFSVYTFIFSIQGPDKGSVLYASGGTKKSALGATQQLLIWLRYCTKIERCFFDFYPFFFFFFLNLSVNCGTKCWNLVSRGSMYSIVNLSFFVPR